MKQIISLVKLVIGGVKNLPRIIFRVGRLTDPVMRQSILSGRVKYPETVDRDACLGCGVCKSICPTNAITMTDLPEKIQLTEKRFKERTPEIDLTKCVFCMRCHDSCVVYTAYHKPAAIHPRGLEISGNKAQDLLKKGGVGSDSQESIA